MLTRVIAIVLVCCPAAAVYAQSSPAQKVVLGAKDYADISNLLALCTQALDSGAENGQVFGGVFTPDGVLQNYDGKTYAGRAALVEHARNNATTRMAIGQVVYNTLIEPAVGGATVTSYVLVTNSNPQPPLLSGIAGGFFHDLVVKTAQGWRIKNRRWTKNANFPTTKASLAPTISLNAKVKPVRVLASEKGGVQGLLTAADYFEIQQLYQRFSRGLDSAADEGNMFASVFVSDGTYAAPDGKTYRGSVALGTLAKNDPDSLKGPTNVTTYNSSIRIDAAPGGAMGRSYVMVVGPGNRGGGRGQGAGGGSIDAGQFLDAFVRTPAGWRIKDRVFCRVNTECGSPQPSGPSITNSGSGIPAEDYAEILQLYARYPYAWDGILEDGAQWIELFTPDGSHINESGGAKEFFFGREELRGFARQRKLHDNRQPGRMGHFLTNIMLEKIPDGVAAKVYRLGANIAPNGSVRFGPAGLYYDYLVKTDEGWRFDRKNYVGANGPLPANALKETPLPVH